MSIFYFFLSTKDAATSQWSTGGGGGGGDIVRSSWNSQLHTVLLSYKKLDELAATCISSYDLVSSSLYMMVHFETLWWVRTNIAEYKATNTFVIPKVSAHSIFSWKEWKSYWAEVKERVLPIVLEHQASVFLLYFFKQFVALIASKETCCRLTQHPFYRSKAISSRESDRLTAGMEMIAVSLWANLLFFASNYTVGRLLVLYNMTRKKRNNNNNNNNNNNIAESLWANLLSFASNPQQQQQQQENQQQQPSIIIGLDGRSMELFWASSWRSLNKTCRRYTCASLGGGLGSMLWSGWGTMLGLGAGDAWAALQPDSENGPPDPFTLLDQLPGSSTPRANESNSNMEKKSSFSSTVSEELLCGCCQIVTFSSNVHSRTRAPVSSRTCDHTICKSCVEKCQLALMERTSSYQEWIKCPLCNAQNAFNSHDHLVNRSLCAAIAMIENQAELKK